MIDVDECVEDDDYVTAVWVMLENCFVRVDGVRKGGSQVYCCGRRVVGGFLL